MILISSRKKHCSQIASQAVQQLQTKNLTILLQSYNPMIPYPDGDRAHRPAPPQAQNHRNSAPNPRKSIYQSSLLLGPFARFPYLVSHILSLKPDLGCKVIFTKGESHNDFRTQCAIVTLAAGAYC